MYRKPCIDVAQFCNDLCIGQNVAMIRDTFDAFCCSAEPTDLAVLKKKKFLFELIMKTTLLCDKNIILK
jgi:hypothetical protein